MYQNKVLAYNKSHSRQHSHHHHYQQSHHHRHQQHHHRHHRHLTLTWLLYCWSLLKRQQCLRYILTTLVILQISSIANKQQQHGAFALAVGVDPAHANLTELGGSPAPKYQTAYACEGKKLTIECDPGDLINLIRANYGRFSITICNDHGNVDWSVNCMFPKSLTVLNSRCSNKQSCSVLATTSMFGDPCPGTHKYLEAHYQCMSASQTSTTTHRPSPPPWVLNNPPPILPNPIGNNLNTSLMHSGVLIPPPAVPPPRLPQPVGGSVGTGPSIWHALPSSPGPPTLHTTLPGGGRLKGGQNSQNGTANGQLPQAPPAQQHHHHQHHGTQHNGEQQAGKTATPGLSPGITTTPPNTRILTGVGGSGSDDSALLTTKTTQHRGVSPTSALPAGMGAVATDAAGLNGNSTSVGGGGTYVRTINNININANLIGDDEANLFCGPTNARNLFWNITRVGDVNVQPCPGGAAGIAKWRCVLMKRLSDSYDDDLDVTTTTTTTTTARPCLNGSNCEAPTMMANKLSNRLRNFEPTWHPMTPDLTQCRSLWLNNLEMRVNQRDSSLISIANDLSEVTSSKTLYGGDMLVTTKIIQTMSEKMFHDKETFPDQRQREAIILELLNGVVKTGSNLLDESQLPSWLDLNQEDQMRVATSLLTGLEYNAFLLADTIIREANVVQKVKNILLSVRVLETKNIQSNVVFPDAEQWQISADRIELPKASLIENSEGGLVRIVFAAFDRLESILKPTYDYFDLKNARSYVRNTVLLNNETADASNAEQRIRILNSKVISASLGKGRHIQLSQPIKLVLKHLKTENVTNPTCVFWNYIDHAWSANGCSLESTNRTHSICMCNHLTNFAILMDVVDEHNHSLFGMFDNNMRILIYVSIAICLVFIVIALLTLKIFNGGVFIKVRNNFAQRQNQSQQQQHRGSSQRRRHQHNQNNNNIIVRDQTHESLTFNSIASVAAAAAAAGVNHHNNNNNNHNSLQQQQINLQNIASAAAAAAQSVAATSQQQPAPNFMQHNPIRHSYRNNLNANAQHFQMQQQQHHQQQQQPQQQLVTAAAAVVVSSSSQNNANSHAQQQQQQQHHNLNNLNLNLNIQPSSQHHLHHHHHHGHNLNHSESVAAVAAAASIAAALQQHAGGSNNLNVVNTQRNLLNQNNSNQNNNNSNFHRNNVNASNNNNNNNSNNNNNNNNILQMQGNLDDLQYKWWWW